MNDNNTVLPTTSRAEVSPRATTLTFAWTGLAGASLEMYDFLLYGTAAALVFPILFFPSTLPPLVALLASFTTFAIGFITRPLGAVLFGHLGDTCGRKHAFVAAMTLMGTGTALIGLLPTYRDAGVFSPITLVILRLAQGVAYGGQWGGGVLLAIESAPPTKRAFYGSIVQVGIPFGVALGNVALLLVNSVLTPAAFLSYGWRIPFLLSIALVVLGMAVHTRLADTPAFRELQEPAPRRMLGAGGSSRGGGSPLLEAFGMYPRSIVVAALANVAGILGFYVLITYAVAYGTSSDGLHLPRGILLAAVLIGTVAMVPALLLSGILSDRWGARRVFTLGTGLIGAWSFVTFPLMDTHSPRLIDLAITAGLCFVALVAGPLARMLSDLFRTRVRYTAVSLAYQMSAVLGGALAPILATAMYTRLRSNFGISLFLAIACLISLTCVCFLGRAHELDEERSQTA